MDSLVSAFYCQEDNMINLARTIVLALSAGVGFEVQSRVVDHFLDAWFASVPALAWLAQ